ncbi:MAG: hypothetical protein M3496_09685 [Pseudomonadota bacterium]|nr:hypothetical protein [Pseudomonadota bacterium]
MYAHRLGGLVAITSELTLAEALVKPFIQRESHLQQLYLETLHSSATLTNGLYHTAF